MKDMAHHRGICARSATGKGQSSFLTYEFRRLYLDRDVRIQLFLRAKRNFFKERTKHMDTRIALIGIIVENMDSIEQLNHLLHEYSSYIVGRMGIPYREKGVNIISVAIDAPQDAINALSGKIGRLDGITAKTVYSNVGA